MKKATQPAPALWVSILLVVLYATFTRAANAPVPVTADELGGSERYLAYVSTDKPVYRSGETVYLRTVFLNAKDNTPCLLYTSPSPRDRTRSRMPSSA